MLLLRKQFGVVEGDDPGRKIDVWSSSVTAWGTERKKRLKNGKIKYNSKEYQQGPFA